MAKSFQSPGHEFSLPARLFTPVVHNVFASAKHPLCYTKPSPVCARPPSFERLTIRAHIVFPCTLTQTASLRAFHPVFPPVRVPRHRVDLHLPAIVQKATSWAPARGEVGGLGKASGYPVAFLVAPSDYRPTTKTHPHFVFTLPRTRGRIAVASRPIFAEAILACLKSSELPGTPISRVDMADDHSPPPSWTPIPATSMTIDTVCSWILNATPATRNAIITDVSWWAESQTVERAGKVFTSRTRVPVDKVTFVPATYLTEAFEKTHTLLFALLTDLDIVPRTSFCYGSFCDFLDYKWAGPSARLGDLPRYFEVIAAQAPKYSLTSGNCFYFARLLFHTIALRHYSFPLVATSIPTRKYVLPRTPENIIYSTEKIQDDAWRRHDPSSIGLVFRFLLYEEWRNGILMFRRIVTGITTLIYLGTLAGSAMLMIGIHYGVSQAANAPTSFYGYIGGFIALAVFFTQLAIILGRRTVAYLASTRIRTQTEAVMRIFDEGSDPEAIRGDYNPPLIPFVRVKKQRGNTKFGVRFHRRPSWRHRLPETMGVSAEERKLPSLWENEKQIFAPRSREYWEAWDVLNSQQQQLETSLLIQRGAGQGGVDAV
ncbi:hypothetical protein C8F01DRAFT_1376750 [Mycena amicta]|nr:hypothetical protein C8F01DRAFT_1376750 [Mycena amicta]